MSPAVLDGLRSDHIPFLYRDPHGFDKVDFVDFCFTCIIEVKGLFAEKPLVVGLVATDDSSIKRLDVGGDIRSKIDQLDVLWFIVNEVSRKIVDQEYNVAVLLAHFDVKVTNKPRFCQMMYNSLSNLSTLTSQKGLRSSMLCIMKAKC
jgi:hypothetical protein